MYYLENENYITLSWEGPFRIDEFLGDNSMMRDKYDRAGVYIHTVTFPGNEQREIMAYVGKSNNIYKRQQEHFACLIGGLYMIPKAFRDTNDDDWIPDLIIEGYADVVRNADSYYKLVMQGHKYASKRSVYISVVDCNWKDKSTREVERNLLYKLKPYATKTGKVSRPKEEISIRHVNSKWGKAIIEKVFAHI